MLIASRYFLPIACRRHGRATSIVRRRLFLAAVVLFGAVVPLLLPVCRLCWHTLRIFTRLQVTGGLSYIRSAYMLRFVRLQFYRFPQRLLPTAAACYVTLNC
jgi:hypothetical protein